MVKARSSLGGEAQPIPFYLADFPEENMPKVRLDKDDKTESSSRKKENFANYDNMRKSVGTSTTSSSSAWEYSVIWEIIMKVGSLPYFSTVRCVKITWSFS